MFLFALRFEIFITRFTKIIHSNRVLVQENELSLYLKKMNNKTILLEEYVNFVDTTEKQNKNFKTIIILDGIIVALFLFFFI